MSITEQGHRFKPSNVSLETNTSENKNCRPMWVKFTCVASEANPLVTAYQLYKNDTPFSTVNDGTLTVEVSDKGTHFYSCLALHDAGNVSSSNVSVTFNVPVQISHSLNIGHTTLKKGGKVSLFCNASGFPNPTITWTKNVDGADIPIEKDNWIIFTSITRNESGNYTCYANNTCGPKTSVTSIDVQYPPENVILTKDTSSNVCAGITVKFTCTADANPPVNLYTLYENNEPVENMSRTGENTKHLTEEGQFVYQCEANNSVGASRSSDTNLIVDVPASVMITSEPMVIKEGDNVIFFCNVSGSLSSSVRWIKTPTDQMIDGASWSVQKISRNSTGEYTCVASNACGNYSNTTFVNVQYAPTVTVHKCPSPVTEGDNAILYCNASGNPTPNIAWIRASTGKVVALHERLFIGAIKRNETESYECLAWNGIGQNSTRSCAIDVAYPPEIIRPSNSVWEISSGESTNVECLANARPAAQYAWMNSNGAVVSHDRYLRFNEKDGIIGGNYTCTAQNSLGSDSFSILVRVRRMQIALEMIVSNVEYQPDYDNLNSNIANTFVDKFVKEVDSIYKNKPSYSRAKVTRLRKGSVIVSFVLSFTTSVTTSEGIAELITELNEGAIGSYKVAALTIIPSLAPTVSTTVTPGTPTTLPGKETTTGSSACNDNDVVLGTLGALIGLLVVIIILLVIFIFWQRKTGIGRKQRSYEAPLDEKEVYDNEIAMDDFTPTRSSNSPQQLTMPRPTYMELQETNRSEHTNPPNVKLPSSAHSAEYAPLHPKTRLWEVARVNVTIEKIIGKGAFGQIAKATAVDLPRKPGKTMVAVKMLKSNAPESDKKDLLSELEVMKTLKPHPHVVKLLGCVTEFEPLWVLIEYVPYGDLLGYLRRSRGLNDTYYKDPDVKPQTSLTSQQLMKFAWQIADGMSYLSSRKIIHRDLAARNVLVGEGETCKVTDFGMARDVQQENIYEKKTRGRLPVKWTAYESLLYGTYTTKSDVWSYGIVLYEIFTIGGSPYPRMDGKRIANALQHGYRMPKPQHVDDALYQIMMNCWQNEPEARPSFPALTKQLKDMEKQHKRLINMHIYDNELYGNLEDLNV